MSASSSSTVLSTNGAHGSYMANLFIVAASGEVLIEKHWHHGVAKRGVVDAFWEHVLKASKRTEVPPVISTPKHYFLHIVRSGLTFLTAITHETPPLFVLELLHKIADTLQFYLKGTLNNRRVKDNFTLIYQLLDEMVDGGFTFTTEPNQLTEMIEPPSVTQRVLASLSGSRTVKEKLPMGALSRIPWRKGTVKYVTNEMSLAITERLDAIVAPNGQLLVGSVLGEVDANIKLSGVPDILWRINHTNIFNDVSLHRCVRISRFVRDRSISFVPPDGKFRLMTYRVRGITQLPVQVRPTMVYRKGQGKINISVSSRYAGGRDRNGRTKDSAVSDVVIVIPFPKAIISSQINVNCGQLNQDSATKMCRWVIGKMPTGKTPELRGTVKTPSNVVLTHRPTIRCEFQLRGVALSGIRSTNLQVAKVKYKPYKNVSVQTVAGRYHIRV